MALDLQLGAGSFTGHVFPVDLDAAYTPDGSHSAAVVGTAALYFDEAVVRVVKSSITSGGSYTEGSGVIFWSGQTLPPGGAWAKFGASFQWVDFNTSMTWMTGTWVSEEGGPTGSTRLSKRQPPVVRGLALD